MSVGLLSVSLLSAAGPAAAEPTSPAEAERRADELAQRVTVLAEQYNAARVDLAAARKRQAALSPRAAALGKQVDAYRARVSEFAAAAYRSDDLGALNALLQSGSPAMFLDQLVTLDVLSRGQAAELNRLIAAREQLAGERAKVDRAVADQQRQEKIIAASRAAAERDLAEFERLRAQVRARASRTSPRTGATPDAPPSAASGPAYSGSTATRGGKVVRFAYAQLGKPYVFGADGPGSYDCSGLTLAAYATVGISLPHSARKQYAMYGQISRSSLRPGDLVYFYSGIGHNGIYVGDGMVIHAPKPGDVVKKSPMTYMPFVGANRPS